MPPRPSARSPGRPGDPRLLDSVLAALNGVLGDHLHRRGNGLATEFALFHRGRPVPRTAEELRREFPRPGRRLAVWLHGLCTDLHVWTVAGAQERSFPARLDEELGFAPILVRFNSGRHVSENGALLAARLEELVERFPVPVEELLLVGFSMGGLVIRSACHQAVERGHRWPRLVGQAIYLGVPHLGSPVERLGRVVAWGLRTVPNPYTRLIASVADLRSAGIQDMGRGRLLREHWEGADPAAPLHDPHHPLPLLPGIRHGLIAGHLRGRDRDLLAALFGDGMVPLASASAGLHRAAGGDAGRVRVVPGVFHVGLPTHPEVYRQLRDWCAEEAG